MKDNKTNQEQFNKIIEFRQKAYACLEKGADAQFQLVEGLLSGMKISSVAELSLSPQFERGWGSAYDGVENGKQKGDQLENLFISQLPKEELIICPLDTTLWAHPKAKTLPGLMYEISPTKAARKHTAVVGHVYSLLSWVTQRGKCWGLGLSNERMTLETDALELGVEQVKNLMKEREKLGATGEVIVPADGKYGTHLFFAPLKDIAHLAIVTRLRRDRVLYGSPPTYSGRGRPRKHGERFAFKEEDSWHGPDEEVTFTDERWGQVRLRGWHNLHMKQDAQTPITAIFVQVHTERKNPPQGIWLGFQAEDETHSVQTAWWAFDHRWAIEPSIRFRKQHLHWTLPKWQDADRCDRWTMLIETAFWQLHLARQVVQDNPLPWQKKQTNLTPNRTLQSFASLFGQIGSPTRPFQTRQNGKGWVQGKPRTRPPRFKPHKRDKKQRKKPAKTA